MTTSIQSQELGRGEDIPISVDTSIANEKNNSKVNSFSEVGCCRQISNLIENILELFLAAILMVFGGICMTFGSIGLSISVIISLSFEGLIAICLLPFKIIQIMINTCCHKHTHARHIETSGKKSEKSVADLEAT
ncbi:hypothetical protein CLAVI_000670 [Candidatus Clavichlamydia salmonicola]|uniref:hypothetical protein n=1 Tax=Candidatus Clavichlamydia salmonicola TaxID=469812 RepID=UPI00189176A0|nr:hypothetical protein [Candidatus Clavichlamydia salmonicola]MBF5051042.1 hypothetical protein [Candidatus Clavichlamydia salmonicola]